MIVRGQCIDPAILNGNTCKNLMADKINLENEDDKNIFRDIWDDSLVETLNDDKILIYV